MRIIVKDDRQSASRLAAELIATQIRAKPNCALGLATGRTPLPLYRELVRLHREEGLSFARIRTFNLDEYLGLGASDVHSFHSYMQRHFFDQVDIGAGSCQIPDGLAADIDKACRDYEAQISAAGGIDLQLLGLGLNGHIGFNEPSSPLDSRTRLVTLTAATRLENADLFGDDAVPSQALTMGIATILETRACLLLAFGTRKAEIVEKALRGPVSTEVPASALQRHPRLTVVLDKMAAALLKEPAGSEMIAGEPPGSS